MTIPVIPWDGQPISKPGVYSGVDILSYHRQLTVGPSISTSGAKKIFFESPAHYFDESYLNPDRETKPASDALIFGRGAHHLILGEADFRKHFVIRPEEYPDRDDVWMSSRQPGDSLVKWKPWAGASHWCKAWLGVAEYFGYTVLTANDIKAIRGMSAALAKDPLVQAGILNGLIEHSFVWQDETTGVWLKWRPDAIPTDSLNFSDLKTIAEITQPGIQRAIDNLGYNMQGALGDMACRAVLGREMADFTLVFVEKTRPHVVANRTLKPSDITLGLEQLDVALRLFAKCLETGHWPGPSGDQADAEYVGISTRAETRIRDRIAEIERQLA